MSALAPAYGASPVKRTRRSRTDLAEVDDAIVAAVAVEHPVSLRGVFYRVVSAGAVEKTELGYRLVSRQLVKLRAEGRVPYWWITDGTRLMRKPRSYRDIDQMLETAAASYRRALWEDQDVEVIVLSEKDAISGSIYPVTSAWDVELGITRGYSSVTFAYSIADTVIENTANGKVTWIYQLGDHDPSGVDGWRALRQQVTDFAPDGAVAFRRLAVTEAQIEELGLPTRPTKTTDSRAASFEGESVEVDAIPPTILRSIVEDAITSTHRRHQASPDPHRRAVRTRCAHRDDRRWPMRFNLYRDLFLTELFRRADDAGLGIATGPAFEAFPARADAAADYMETIVDDVLDWTDRAFTVLGRAA